MFELDCVVIGAGVVGLAVARELAQLGREVVLIEQHSAFGQESSSRNSEVIHAGIYYPQGSLKAFHCVRGRKLLYEYCDSHQVAYRQIGKVIVAVTPDETAVLEKYLLSARANGAGELQLLSASELASLEPNVHGVMGLLSPHTGIIDSHGLMQSFLTDLERSNGMLICNTQVISASAKDDGIELEIQDVEEVSRIHAKWVINCAGLHATEFARKINAIPKALIPPTEYAIGHYYQLQDRSPFNRLIYPIAPSGGLGIHATLDLGGGTKFGPDLRWIQQIDYQFDDHLKQDFVNAIARYYPAINANKLEPSYTGIRPKIGGRAKPNVDFSIQTPQDHSVKGLINLFGIESPGLTASLSLAKFVGQIVSDY